MQKYEKFKAYFVDGLEFYEGRFCTLLMMMRADNDKKRGEKHAN